MPATRVRQIGEQPRHLQRRLEIPLGIGREPPAGRVERRMLADAGQHVEERPLVRCGEAHAAGRDDRHAKRLGEADERVVVVFLIAAQVPLQLHIDLAASEEADEPIEQAADAEALGEQQRPPGQRDEALGEASRSSSVSAPSPFGERSFIRVMRRHRFFQPSEDSTRTGSVHLAIWGFGDLLIGWLIDLTIC